MELATHVLVTVFMMIFLFKMLLMLNIDIVLVRFCYYFLSSIDVLVDDGFMVAVVIRIVVIIGHERLQVVLNMLTNHVEIGLHSGLCRCCLIQHVLFFVPIQLLIILIVTVVVWVAGISYFVRMQGRRNSFDWDLIFVLLTIFIVRRLTLR